MKDDYYEMMREKNHQKMVLYFWATLILSFTLGFLVCNMMWLVGVFN